jgi:GTP-binding protein Era
VSAVLLVETSSQKRIVVGTGGAVIREIGTRARPELEELLGRKLYLDLRVKVKERWRRDEGVLDRMGV